MFLKILNTVEAHERYFPLDLFCVACIFYGKLSRLEKYHLPQAYQELTDTYIQRTQQITTMLIDGRIHAAKALCKLDFYPG